MKVLIVTMAILIITVNSQDLEMGLCIPCLTECAADMLEVLELKDEIQKKGKLKFPNYQQIYDSGCKKKIYDDKQIHNQSVKICCMKGDIFEKDETIKTNFKHSYDESKDLITIEDTKNGVKANIGKCIFCNSKIFYADCKKKRKTCSKTYRKVDLDETCPPNMAFAGRIGMKKFFTLKDFIVVNPESVKNGIYKDCHIKDKEQKIEANPLGTLKMQLSRGFNMCCNYRDQEKKEPLCQICLTYFRCAKHQKSVLTINEDYKGILSETSLFKQEKCMDLKDEKQKVIEGQYLNFLHYPVPEQKINNGAMISLNICCGKVSRGVKYS